MDGAENILTKNCVVDGGLGSNLSTSLDYKNNIGKSHPDLTYYGYSVVILEVIHFRRLKMLM